MPGGRLRSQLLITSRCLGWCGERGSERGSLPLNNLELNWMSHFLNQRTTAGFNSFSARKLCRLSLQPARAVPPLPRASVSVTRPGGTAGAQLPPSAAAPHSKGETPTPPSPAALRIPKPLSVSEGLCGSPAPTGVWDPHVEGKKGRWVPPAGAQGREVFALRFPFSRHCFSLFSQRNSVCRNARQC